ncbi:transmembrane protein 43, putative [Ichthyophthirius multifiliis]|uniref:Transmembrane protein 43, putative n=1 Tax=Ichthyophthirius multifiliis TaxID=5932 RepID=G0R0B3_ICHMU|nr:transmembrane protein 43, putative [Ichthyophthirius multifiliis]EGR29091.1 transmembrane protein 43, putative [Ichthyophthirius multifiliis]|eukprot:XP_004030327.1 transmembrane protein 43, putative [Ichthyophthirius multifiliis]
MISYKISITFFLQKKQININIKKRQKNHYIRRKSNSRNSAESIVSDLVFGILIFISAFPLLWYNERGYAKTKQFLKKWLKKCIQIDSMQIDPQFENVLVFTQGETKTNDILIDGDFNIQINNCIKIKRKCQIYCWQEYKHSRRISNNYEEIYYTHNIDWRNEFIDSQYFHENIGHQNYKQDWLYDSKVIYAPNVFFGTFKLSEKQKEMCENSEIIRMNQQQYQGHKQIQIIQDYIYFRKIPNQNSCGDFRVQFTKCTCGESTIIAKQHQNTFEVFHPGDYNEGDTHFGDAQCCSCCFSICEFCRFLNQAVDEINWIKEKHISKEEFFNEKLQSQEFKTWLIRLCGYLLLVFGIFLMLSPIYKLLYWFPFVGKFLGTIGSLICLLVGLIVAIPPAIIVIGLAWLFYRKEIGIPLLTIAIGFIIYFIVSYQKDYKGDKGY